MVNNAISFLAAIFLGFSKLAHSFPMLVIGRGLIGIFAGECRDLSFMLFYSLL